VAAVAAVATPWYRDPALIDGVFDVCCLGRAAGAGAPDPGFFLHSLLSFQPPCCCWYPLCAFFFTCRCPPCTNVCVRVVGALSLLPQVKVLTKRPIEATEEEAEANPRSRPAMLRVCERLGK
jgi:hypothetical protein